MNLLGQLYRNKNIINYFQNKIEYYKIQIYITDLHRLRGDAVIGTAEGLGLVCVLNLRGSVGTPSGELARPTGVRFAPVFGFPRGDDIKGCVIALFKLFLHAQTHAKPNMPIFAR